VSFAPPPLATHELDVASRRRTRSGNFGLLELDVPAEDRLLVSATVRFLSPHTSDS
jgi:hypothetical protein